MSTIRRSLTEDEYCFESSYAETYLANRLPFGSWRSTNFLKIYFGHFMNECHLAVFRDRKMVIFTGVREPVNRAVSALRQQNAVRLRGGLPFVTPEEFLSDDGNSMVGEILRAFPSLKDQYAVRASAALAAFSLMDFVYSTERFASDASWIFENLDISPALISDNDAANRGDTEEELAIASKCRGLLIAGYPSWLAEDLVVYEALEPHLSNRNFRIAIADESWAINRDDFISKSSNPLVCRSRLQELEAGYLAWEFALLGKAGELIEGLKDEIREREHVIKVAQQYVGAD